MVVPRIFCRNRRVSSFVCWKKLCQLLAPGLSLAYLNFLPPFAHLAPHQTLPNRFLLNTQIFNNPSANMLTNASVSAGATPAMAPPPGVISNYSGPNPLQTLVIAVMAITIFLSTTFTLLRVYAQHHLFSTFTWSDRKFNPARKVIEC